MPNVGGMEGAGETQLYKGTCKFLVTKTGGDRYLLVCRRQRIGHKETLHRSWDGERSGLSRAHWVCVLRAPPRAEQSCSSV